MLTALLWPPQYLHSHSYCFLLASPFSCIHIYNGCLASAWSCTNMSTTLLWCCHTLARPYTQPPFGSTLMYKLSSFFFLQVSMNAYGFITVDAWQTILSCKAHRWQWFQKHMNCTECPRCPSTDDCLTECARGYWALCGRQHLVPS